MPDLVASGPQVGEVRSAGGETRKWTGTRWEPADKIGVVSPNEPDTYLGGAAKGFAEHVGEQKGKMSALGGLFGSLAGAPHIGAGVGRGVADFAEKAANPETGPSLGQTAFNAGATSLGSWGLGKIMGLPAAAGELGDRVVDASEKLLNYHPVKAGVAYGTGKVLQGVGALADNPAVRGLQRVLNTDVADLNPFKGGGGAAPASMGPRPLGSSPVAPYTQGPEELPMGGVVKETPLNLDRLSPEAYSRTPVLTPEQQPGIGRSKMPDLSQTPTHKYNAEVGVAGDWHPPPTTMSSTPAQALQGLQVPPSAPTGPASPASTTSPLTAADRAKLIADKYSPEMIAKIEGAIAKGQATPYEKAPVLGTSLGNDFRAAPPQGAMGGLRTADPNFNGGEVRGSTIIEPPSTADARMPRRPAGVPDPAKREFPPGLDAQTATPQKWGPAWNDFYNKAMGNEEVNRIRTILSSLLGK